MLICQEYKADRTAQSVTGLHSVLFTIPRCHNGQRLKGPRHQFFDSFGYTAFLDNITKGAAIMMCSLLLVTAPVLQHCYGSMKTNKMSSPVWRQTINLLELQQANTTTSAVTHIDGSIREQREYLPWTPSLEALILRIAVAVIALKLTTK